MIADVQYNKTLTVSKLFIKGRKLNISLVFISQSYFRVLKLNVTHYFVLKIPKKKTSNE